MRRLGSRSDGPSLNSPGRQAGVTSFRSNGGPKNPNGHVGASRLNFPSETSSTASTAVATKCRAFGAKHTTEIFNHPKPVSLYTPADFRLTASTTMAEQLRVMISSTTRDLPEHREKVMHACLRMGMFRPDMMEHLTARNAYPEAVSLSLVEKADVYLAIVGFRYGYVPAGAGKSVTEMEFDRATEKGIPRLVFLMHDSHVLRPHDVETGEGAQKLAAFRERLSRDLTVCFFRSPDELLALVIQSLSEFRQSKPTSFHYVSKIPSPPEPYIAHPYTLLETHGLIGRLKELRLLKDWITGSLGSNLNVLSFIAVGGIGKSALTWKWYKDTVSEPGNYFAGSLWWSFYESDATFENFVTRALAYVSRRAVDEIEAMSITDRESELLAAFDQDTYLVVLDGLERILVAYARMDAAHLADSDYDRQEAASIADAAHLPVGAADSFLGEHTLRKTADPRVGVFLRKLSRTRSSRFVITSRLYPADLQNRVNNEPRQGCLAFLTLGLRDDDALTLWHALGVSGQRESLLQLFNLFGNHPLLLQALASEVARSRRAPGNFDLWRQANPEFDPFRLPLVQVKSHVLEFALRGLSTPSRETLRVIAAFRMPVPYDTLAALLIEERQICSDEHNLDWVLTDLEDRGLIGWDRRGNRYDMHPIVRGVVWSGLDSSTRKGVYSTLQTHFEALPVERITSAANLAPTVELFNTLIGLAQYDNAYVLFRDRLSEATLYNVNANSERVSLLEMLFPDGLNERPKVDGPNRQAFTLNALAIAYLLIGRPGDAVNVQKRAIDIVRGLRRNDHLCVSLYNLSNAARLSGRIREAELSGRTALIIAREGADRFQEAAALKWLGAVHIEQGPRALGTIALKRACILARTESNEQIEGTIYSFLALSALRTNPSLALSFCAKASDLSLIEKLERDLIFALRVRGTALLRLGDWSGANEAFHQSLSRARDVQLAQEEIPILIGLAELRRQQENRNAARDFIEDCWDLSDRGPYPGLHADAHNVLAEIERDEGNTKPAIEAATKAYKLAWCDGPPFAYHWGLEKAKQHLRELGAPEPEMPPFDESKFEPMPEVEINPRDEFYVDEESID